jgi:hypothetical protein
VFDPLHCGGGGAARKRRKTIRLSFELRPYEAKPLFLISDASLFFFFFFFACFQEGSNTNACCCSQVGLVLSGREGEENPG